MFAAAKKLFSPPVDVEMLKRFGAHTQYTPDYWYLEQRKAQLFLVTDEMMRKHRAHDLLANEEKGQFLMQAYTKERFKMLKKVLGKATFPVVMEADSNTDRISRGVYNLEPLPVRGELWKVYPETILELDKYKLNTVQFRRRRVELIIPYQVVTRHSHGPTDKPGRYDVNWQHYTKQSAWMYVGEYDYFFKDAYSEEPNFLAGVEACVPSNPNKSPYYYYTVKENVF